MNVKEIKTLVGIMEDSSLTALEIEVPDLKLRLERSAGTGSVAEVLQPPVYSVPAAAPAPAPEAVPAASAAPVQPAAAEPQAAARENAFYKEIKAPMVGVFYTSSAPEAEPYVTKGSQVKKGDVVCIIDFPERKMEDESGRNYADYSSPPAYAAGGRGGKKG